MQSKPDIYAIIVAGGTGTRFGSDIPKQFSMLRGEPMLIHSIRAFRRLLPIDNIVTVLPYNMIDYWYRVCRKRKYTPGPVTSGGLTRWESTKNGVNYFKQAQDDDIILIHDAARPLIKEYIIYGVIEALKEGYVGAIPVIPVSDSYRIIEKTCSTPIDREKLRAVQTPQGFRYSELNEAYTHDFSPLYTDEATMMEACGYKNIKLTSGDPVNFKITLPIDLILAEQLLNGG